MPLLSSLLVLCLIFQICVRMKSSSTMNTEVDVNTKLLETKTHLYFLIGPGIQPILTVNAFIRDMGFESRHYEKILAFDRNVIAKYQSRVLRYLVFDRKMITKQWVRRYITGVDDPASRVKNLGRLALAMTFDKTLQAFLNSDYENCLVFEDDVILNHHHHLSKSKTVLQIFSDMLSIPATQWDMQYLGFCFECTERGKPLNHPMQAAAGRISTPLYTTAIFPLCTHAIMLSRAATFVIMNTYKPFVSNKGDWLLHLSACEQDLKVIRPLEPLFLQNVTAATVGGSQLGNYNDKRPFASWVHCEKEIHRCKDLRMDHVAHNLSNISNSSVLLLRNKLLYTPGIPRNYIL